MFEVRIHGRGGQGAVTAAELLSVAAFDGGSWAQAFPSFGSERMGAPVASYCRISSEPLRLREPVLTPDALLILDPTLLHVLDVFAGLEPHGIVLVNSARTPHELGLADLYESHPDAQVITVPATDIALRRFGRPLPNGVMLGAFAALTGQVTLDAVRQALHDRFPGQVGIANSDGADEAFALMQSRLKEPSDA